MGRPKGARNRATMAAETLLEGQAEALTQKAIELALGGDINALRLCLDRLLPPRRDRVIAIPLPPITDAADVPAAIGAVIDEMADGHISPSEALTVVGLIETYRQALERAPGQPSAPVISVNFT